MSVRFLEDLNVDGNLTINSTYPRIFLTDSNHNDDWSIINNDGKFGIYNDTDTSYALTVDGSNNVGIGTTSPGGKLDVAGDTDARVILGRAKFDNYVSDYLYLSHFDQGSTTNYALNQSPAGSTSINAPTGQNVALKINNSSKLHVQGTTGNVGIGTTSPARKLSIQGDGNTALSVTSPNTSYVQLALGDTDDDNYGQIILDNSSNKLQIQNGGGSVISDRGITLDSSENVGIGTASPSYKLDVNGGGVKTTTATGNRIAYYDGSGINAYGGSSGYGIRNYHGDLSIIQHTNDGDIIFQSDDGSGGVTNYFKLWGAIESLAVYKDMLFIHDGDGGKLKFGASQDLQIYHDGTDSIIDNLTGNFYIRNQANDKDIIFICDNGSGGTETYFRLDGSASSGDPITIFPDNSKLAIGESSHGITLVHDGSNSSITNAIGNLTITNFQDDGAIIFKSDDGSGSTATYFYVDGSNENVRFEKDIFLLDNVKLRIGSGTDLEIYHDGSHSYIDDSGTGNLKIRSNRLQLEKYTGETMAEFIADGASSLYYDNNKKLETTSTGVEVTGNITVTGTVDSVDIAARDAVLTSTTTTANAALPKTGGTMTGQLAVTHNGGTLNLVGTDHTYIQWYPAGISGGRHAYTGFAGGGTDHFTIANETSGANINLTTNSGTVNVTGNLSVTGTVDGVDISANYANWNTAYGWGDHSSAGYLTSLPSHNHDDRYYTETESDARYAALSHNHAASSIVTGTLADGRISESSVTQHEAALTITEGQLPDDMPSDKVKQICTSHHNFFMNSSSTTADFFVPFNNLNESSNPTNAQYYNRMVAPYNGRIVKVVLNTTAAIGTSCQVLFWVANSISGVFAPSASETVTGVNLNTANSHAVATFSTTSTAEFNEGDVLGVSIIKSSSATANMQVTVVWEYTV